jgi:hypothetical protein
VTVGSIPHASTYILAVSPRVCLCGGSPRKVKLRKLLIIAKANSHNQTEKDSRFKHLPARGTLQILSFGSCWL